MLKPWAMFKSRAIKVAILSGGFFVLRVYKVSKNLLEDRKPEHG